MASSKSTDKTSKSVDKSKSTPRSTKAKSAPLPVVKSASRTARVPAPPAVKVTAAADSGGDTVVSDPVGGIDMKKQELLKKVADQSGMRKNQIKAAVEATLEVLAEALQEGRDLNLPPLGKVKQKRVKETPGARIIIAKIRQSKPGAKADKDTGEVTVADAAE